jgi:hypothetical protein
MASASATPAGVQLNGYQWLPLITKRHSTTGSWAQDGVFAQGEVNHQSISFRMGATFENEVWSAYEWNGALGRIFVQTGEEGDFSTYKQVFEGSVSSLDRQAAIATIGLLGPDATLNRSLLSAEYAGSGAAEGDVGLKGTLKPFAVGNAQSVEPVLVDAAHWIYQVHGYGPVTSIKPYEYAQLLDPSRNKGDLASYADLANLTMVPGDWATCNALGMFRLGGSPSKKVSADVVVGSSTSTQIIRDLLLLAGVPAAKISTLALSQSGPWSYYTTEQITVGELARMAAFHSAGVLFADGTGTWRVMDYLAATTPIVLKADRSATPLVKDYRELNSAAPVYKVRVGYDPCWGVHGANDISPSLLDETAMQAVSEAAEAAQAAADAAAAQAAEAMARLTSISNDNVLDRADKGETIKDYQAILAEFPGLISQGNGLGITTEVTNLTNAKNALDAYLASLTPAYTDFTQDTPIDGPTYRAKFNDYYLARGALYNRMVAVGSTAAYLTNESAVLFANSAGVVSDYSMANGSFVVKRGNTTVTSGVTYSVVNSTGLTINISGSGAYTVTAMSANQGRATLRAVYDGQTFDKVFSAAKAVQGATGPAGGSGGEGAPALSATLSNEAAHVWAFANGNVQDYNGVDTFLSVWSGSTDVTSSFTISVASNPQFLTYTLNGNHLVITGGFAASLDIASITLKVTGNGTYAGSVLTKTFTVSKVKGGYEIVATNPTDNLFEGRVVYNTTTKTLMRFDGTKWTSAVDASDIMGLIDGSKIKDGALDAAKFASTIEPITIVTSVPTTKLTNQIFNKTDGRTYTWDAAQGKYDGSIKAVDIGGKITSEQIDALDAAKLVGNISGTRITDDSIDTDKFRAKSITGDKIASRSIVTSNLAVIPEGIIPDPYFQDTEFWTAGGLDADGWYFEDANGENNPAVMGAPRGMSLKPQPDTAVRRHAWGRSVPFSGDGQIVRLRAKGLAGNDAINVAVRFYNFVGAPLADITVTFQPNSGITTQTAQLAVPVGASQYQTLIYNQGINTFSNYPGVVSIKLDLAASADLLVDGTITGVKIVSDTIEGRHIKADSIDAGQIKAGAIGADEIASNSIGTNKLLVGLRGAHTQDIKFWVEPVGRLNWTGGLLAYADDNGNFTVQAVQPGSCLANNGYVYVSFPNQGYNPNPVQLTALSGNSTAFNDQRNNIQMAIYEGGYTISVKLGSTQIHGGGISTGTITSDQIASGTILTTDLAVTDFANYAVNGDFGTGRLDGWSRQVAANGSGMVIGSDPGWPSKYGLRMWRQAGDGSELSIVNGVNSFDDPSMLSGISMEPGDEIYFECVTFTEGQNSNELAVDVVIRPNASNINLLTPAALENSWVNGTMLFVTPGPWFKTTKAYFRNDTGQRGKAFLRLWGPATGNSNGYWWNIKILKRNNGNLLVDGAVTANKIQAGAIDAGKLAAGEIITNSAQIRNGIIDNAKIGNAAITNAKIGDLEVNTIKIASGTIGVPYNYSAGDLYVGPSLVYTAETPNWVPVGDFAGGGGIIMFTCVADSGSIKDKRLKFWMDVDYGGGWQNGQRSIASGIGARTDGGNTQFKGSVQMVHAFAGSQVRVRIAAQSFNFNDEGPSGSWTVFSPQITIFGAKR